ncbi:interaptin isoform X2 [Nasonia vitripennis]|uniref:Centrobin n=1 Tax=Nasonia vitripennis TaxID=7425 RepID=A0A7M7QM38_NASVI|nr:interaptin isoform X2 [Nasonia vitripennis]
MMSDSDDTDVLLLIPPDLFLVPASDSDDQSDCSSYKKNKSGVVSELIDHVQSLETRISAIESKDSPNNSLNLSRRLSLDSIMSCRQTLPRTKFSVSQTSNLQKTPTKHPSCLSLPSTPSIRQQLQHTNETLHSTKSSGHYQSNRSNPNLSNKHDNVKLFSDPVFPNTSSPNKSYLHVGNGFLESKEPHSLLTPGTNVCENNVNARSFNSYNTLVGRLTSDSKSIKNMSLSEVEEFLQEIESNDKELTQTNGYSNDQQLQEDLDKITEKKSYLTEEDEKNIRTIMEQKLKFSTNSYSQSREPLHQSDHERRKDMSDLTLPNDNSFSSFDTDKFMTEFKAWTPSLHNGLNDSKISISELRNFEENERLRSSQQKDSDQQLDGNNVQNYVTASTQYLDSSLLSKFADQFTNPQVISSSAPEINQNSLGKKSGIPNGQNSASTLRNHDSSTQRPQRLLTLSDFWNHDSSKSQEEQLRIKLEEERFRREHCEQLIQDLQKKLLEQQERVAVAVRVDAEKNTLISQFQITWKKMKRKLSEVESERGNLQKVLKNISDKHQSEIEHYEKQMKNCKEELSKALNLATGYKEKSDCLVKEKVELLKSHADELQSYKLLVQQAESRYEEMKAECQKLLEKNQQTDEAFKAIQQDLNKELLKGSEVRTEMAVIHKALDACEAELTILRQEKESLQLKLKEEINRNNILEQGKASLIAAVDDAKKAEKAALNEVQSLTDQQEKLRAELRDVYQKQVDDVVKTKLQEFQTQLDSAEMVFQNEIETKQRAIAECAARKIKSVIDKHQLEINLVEEKHKEEKRLVEIKLAQAVQKSSMLEAQLNSYRKSKNQLVEQLHSMMQKQWQQALMIISGGNGNQMSSFQKINVDKLFEFPSEINLELVPNHCSTLHSEQMKLNPLKSSLSSQNVQTQERENESSVTLTSHNETPLTSRKETKSDLRKYIKMLLDMQQSKEDNSKPKFFDGSPPLSHKDNSDKQSLQKDINTSNDGSSTWQPTSEMSIHDTSEYLSVPQIQKFTFKGDQQRQKPPWK